MNSFLQSIGVQSFGAQLVLLAMVCDGLGAGLGYLLHPTLGVEPLVGVAIGLVLGSVPISLFVFKHAAES